MQRSIKSTPAHLDLFDRLALALFLCRYFMPTEAVERGHTLWIATLCFLLWAIRSWVHWRNQTHEKLRWTGLDIAIVCLVGGHLLSGTFILLGTGDKRAALNLMWEWAALSVVYFNVKHIVRSPAGRQTLLTTLVITGMALAGLGLWQHFVWYKSQAAEVTELLELHDKQTSTQLSADERARLNALSAEHGADLLSLDVTGRQLFLARVRSSLEPIGRFALANTLGGVLACLCTFVCVSIIQKYRGSSRMQLFVSGCGLAFMLTCLLLTKSRTGLLGFVAGIGMFLLGQTLTRQRIKYLSLTVIALFVLVGFLSLSGGLDYEVLSEAPKSLQYRLEYWTATLKMLKEDPVFGSGPGNFRQHYLHYKLPGSSEEILDPHNLFLDVWANGGLLSLVGLLGILVLTGLSRLRLQQVAATDSQPDSKPADDSIRTSATELLFIGTMTGGLVLGYEFLILGIADTVMLVTWLGWMFLAILFSTARVSFSIAPIVSLCAGITLSVNLLAAGGIGMPAVTQLLFALALLSYAMNRPEFISVRIPTLLPLICSLLLFVSILWSAWVPQISVSNLLETGQQEMLVRNQSQRAIKTFTQATELDSLNPEPWQQLASANIVRWSATGKRNEAIFEQAINAQLEAIQRDPDSPNRYRSLGEWWLEHFKTTSNPEDAANAAEAFQKSSELYPSSSVILAQLAIAQSDMPQSQDISAKAVNNAKHALELDDLNIARGHSDKALSETIRNNLQEIIRSANT